MKINDALIQIYEAQRRVAILKATQVRVEDMLIRAEQELELLKSETRSKDFLHEKRKSS